MNTAAYIQRTIIGIACALPVLALAQDGGGGFDQTQIITGDRTLSVQKAYKITDRPKELPIMAPPEEPAYRLIPKRPMVSVEVDTIQPAKVRVREPLDRIYQGYFKAGIGTFATPFAEAMYASGRDRDLAYGVRLKHNSANDGINRDVAFSGFSENRVDLWGKKIFRKHSLRTALEYKRNVWHYYGFDPQGLDVNKDDIKQRFNLFALDADWKSYFRDSSKVNHDIGLDLYRLGDNFDASEFGVNATAFLRAFRGPHYYTLDAGFDLVSYNTETLHSFGFMADTLLPARDQANAIVHATPKVVLRWRGLRAEAGLGLYGRFANEADFHAFPDLEFSYSLFNDIFIPYAGITGSVQRNGFRTLTDQNPYILSQVEVRNTIERIKVFGGIRGSISDHVSFNVSLSYADKDDLPLFVNDTLFSRENRFSVVYDDVNIFNVGGEISYLNDDKWGGTLRGDIFSYSTSAQAEAWQMPAFRFGLNAKYNLFDKLILRTDIAYIGPRKMKSLWPVPDLNRAPGGYWIVDADAFLDLSLGVEYRYTTRLSAFAEAYNLTASKYDVYYRFPAERVFLRGGVKYTF